MAVEYKIIGGDGHEYGPVTLEEIRQWCEDGRVAPGTLVWLSEDRRWLPAGARDELKWDLQSPAAPPVLPPPPVAEELQPAGFWVRSAAYVVDAMMMVFLVSIVTYPWQAEFAAIGNAALAQLKSATPDMAVIFRFWKASLLVDLPVSFVYFVGFNTLRGATPGKQMLGLRILNADGSRLTFGRAFLRHCGEWISRFTLGAGFLLVLFTPQKQALHDLLAHTRVVFRPHRFGP
jgi:uncharacterized RDD family membrane protein YckC